MEYEPSPTELEFELSGGWLRETWPKKQRRRYLSCLTLAGAVVAIVACLAAVVFETVFTEARQNLDEWQALTNDYMEAMSERDVAAAYRLFDPEMQDRMSQAELEAFIDGPSFYLFEGYQDLSVESWYLNFTDEGTTAELSGVVKYLVGSTPYEGSFEAQLTQQREAWRIWSINVAAPPEKLSRYEAVQ